MDEKKHPHVRGEDISHLSSSLSNSETLPRAWGRPIASPSSVINDGNTPTCVGKTPSQAICISICWKHPHVRGEDPDGSGTAFLGIETPPRAWGRLLRNPSRAGKAGNTPTCVGKTLADAPGAAACRKHPHVRGEDTNILLKSPAKTLYVPLIAFLRFR